MSKLCLFMNAAPFPIYPVLLTYSTTSLCVASSEGTRQPRVAVKVTAMCDPALLVSVDESV